MSWVSMEERVERARKLVDTMMGDEELKAAGRTVSIDDAALARGAQLVQAAKARNSEQVRLEGLWDDIRTRRKALRDEVVNTYMQHRRVAKLSIEAPAVRKVLDITGTRETQVIKQHAQMTTFYTEGLSDPDALAELNRVGITKALLEAGRTKLSQILALVDEETSARSKKEEAMDVRDDALDALDRWYAETYKGMEFATRATPAIMGRVKP